MAQAIPFIIAIGSGALSAKQAHDAGVMERQANNMAAKQEGDAARQREVERRRALLTALSSQVAAAGANGVAFTGSTAAGALRDIKYAAEDLLFDRANTSARVGALRVAGANAVRMGNANAVTSLLDSAGKAYMAYGGMRRGFTDPIKPFTPTKKAS